MKSFDCFLSLFLAFYHDFVIISYHLNSKLV